MKTTWFLWLLWVHTGMFQLSKFLTCQCWKKKINQEIRNFSYYLEEKIRKDQNRLTDMLQNGSFFICSGKGNIFSCSTRATQMNFCHSTWSCKWARCQKDRLEKKRNIYPQMQRGILGQVWDLPLHRTFLQKLLCDSYVTSQCLGNCAGGGETLVVPYKDAAIL